MERQKVPLKKGDVAALRQAQRAEQINEQIDELVKSVKSVKTK